MRERERDEKERVGALFLLTLAVLPLLGKGLNCVYYR